MSQCVRINLFVDNKTMFESWESCGLLPYQTIAPGVAAVTLPEPPTPSGVRRITRGHVSDTSKTSPLGGKWPIINMDSVGGVVVRNRSRSITMTINYIPRYAFTRNSIIISPINRRMCRLRQMHTRPTECYLIYPTNGCVRTCAIIAEQPANCCRLVDQWCTW